jgi:cyclic-di-GMP phosphodiesterase TipF (flagellum assembly factor)
MRLAALFVAVCMVLIAGSAGAAVYFAFGFRPAEAVLVGVAVLTALSIYNTVSARIGMRTVVSSQLRDLSRGNAEMARQLGEVERHFAALERRVEGTLNKTRAATDPLSAEIGELGLLVRQLAETVAVHETRLAELRRPQPAGAREAPAVPPRPAPAEPAIPAEPVAAAPAAAPADPAPSAADASAASDAMQATIGAAIEASRIDLYLQPIVTLPQRKVRYYEAMSRLRTDKGDVVPAASFIAPAEAGGLMPKIDNLVVFRCVQVIRRLLMKNREIGLFCNLSGGTLTDGTVFPQLLDFLDANRAIAPALVLEFTQSALRAIGPMETESLSALAERGFRFSLDNVTDLRLEPRELATRGFRFVKVNANLLLNRTGATGGDIHPADLSDLLSRFGIDLIAEKIENEGSVVDLLDYDVRFGQGFLFSPPRPVRAEALQGIADRGDLVTREATDEAAPPLASGRAPEAGPPAENGSGKRVSAMAQIARRI